ncbi:MAG: hypothetical protein ACR2LN_00130 [Candidatus Levyibacteriota bacterium]
MGKHELIKPKTEISGLFTNEHNKREKTVVSIRPDGSVNATKLNPGIEVGLTHPNTGGNSTRD